MGLAAVIVSAIVMFASSNVDDVLVLVVYFAAAAEGKQGFKPRHIWIGQIVGFTIIMIASVIGAYVGSFLPPHYSGLLGIVPLLMGLWQTREWCEKDEDGDSTDDEQRGLIEEGRSGSIASPTAAKSRPSEPSADGDEAKELKWCSALFSVHSLKMMAVMLGNGGDDVAIYTPVLVPYSVGEILLTVAIFYVLLVAWLYVAGVFVSFRFVAKAIEKYGDYVTPVALILLGVYIMWSADVLALVCSSC